MNATLRLFFFAVAVGLASTLTSAQASETKVIDIYEVGRIVKHEGAWQHGKDNAQAGIMMPGEALIGAAYYQEYAPKQAMGRGRIKEVDGSIKTPAGELSNCLKVWEENPLDGDSETCTRCRIGAGRGSAADRIWLPLNVSYL